MQSNTCRGDTPGDDSVTWYAYMKGVVELALSRLAHAATTDDPHTAQQQHSKAWIAYRKIAALHPTVCLEPVQRDALLAQLAVLRFRLDECGDRSP